ncbi:MAG: hypothetical protein ACREH4_08265, partial [Vitreimonas sp.]
QELYVLNNTGATIQVIESAQRWQDQTGKVYAERWRFSGWPFLIDNGAGRRIHQAGGAEWILHVRVGRCRVRFDVTIANENDTSREFPRGAHVMAQIEPNGRLYRVYADGLRAVDVAPFVAIQPEGFPVEPSSRVCSRR